MLIPSLLSFTLVVLFVYPIKIQELSKVARKEDNHPDLEKLILLRADLDYFSTTELAGFKYLDQIEIIKNLKRLTGMSTARLVDHLIACERDEQTLIREFENRSATAFGASVTLAVMPLFMWFIGLAIGIDVLGFVLSPAGFVCLVIGLALILISRITMSLVSRRALAKPALTKQITVSANVASFTIFVAVISFVSNFAGFVLAVLLSIYVHNFWHSNITSDYELEKYIKRDYQHFVVHLVAAVIATGLSWTKTLNSIDDEELKIISSRIDMGISPAAAFGSSTNWQDIGELISLSVNKGTSLASELILLADEYRQQNLSYRIKRSEKFAGRLVIPVNLLQLPAFILMGLIPIVGPIFIQTLETFHI